MKVENVTVVKNVGVRILLDNEEAEDLRELLNLAVVRGHEDCGRRADSGCTLIRLKNGLVVQLREILGLNQ